MKQQRPILFKSEMVQAILAGRKTQTRRALKIQPSWVESNNPLVSSGWQYEGKKGLPKLSSWPTKEDFATALLECEKCPYGQVGDQLWVKETWKPRIAHSCAVDACDCGDVEVEYIADNKTIFYSDNIDSEWLMPKAAQNGKNVSSLFMPRWASRILLEITDIRVERLQDISEADAKAEGCCYGKGGGVPDLAVSPEDHFPTLWESINGVGSWEANPWVWRISFRVVEPQGGAV